ncbi:AfsR/SARP family transcriptional regulator, partial [Actinophytocola sediminis]
MVDFRVLGPVEIRDARDEVVGLRARLDRALLALLLLNANSRVSVDSLTSRLWVGRNPPKSGAREYLQDLRGVLRAAGGNVARLAPARETTVFEVDPQYVDYLRCREHLATARSAEDPERVVAAARAALGEWRGEALQNLDGDWLWVVEQRQALDLLRGEAWRLLIAAELELGRHEQVLGEISEPLGRWPDDETLVGLWMRALHRAGHRSRALGVFHEFSQRLEEEHGAGPGGDLQALQRRILDNDLTLDAPIVQQGKDGMGAVVGLPARPVLVGRADEVRELVELLAPTTHVHAVVVSAAVGGLPGVGKTALAIYAAHDALASGWFSGGALFLDLQGYSPIPVLPEQALFQVLVQLGVPVERLRGSGQELEGLYQATLAAHARVGQRLLIIADNAGTPEQVRPLLPGSTEHRLLITSRNTLGALNGTRLLDLAVLDPDAAIAMLEQHLRAARPGDDRISTAREDAARIAELCGYLPLALRISAALLADDPGQPVAELAEELADTGRRLHTLDYDDTFSVRVAFNVSYEKLSPEQARLFRLLALNPGPQTSTDAAAALTGQPGHAARRQLTELHRAHLVEHGSDREWWQLHDLIALYVRERVEHDEPPSGREQAFIRLLDHYLATTRAAADHLGSRRAPADRMPGFTDRRAALAWLDTEHPTLAAVITGTAGIPHDQHVIGIARHLHEYYELRKHPAERLDVARHALAAAQRTADQHTQGTALNNLGRALAYLRRFDEAIACYDQALPIRREVGDRHGEGRTLSNLGIVFGELRRFDEAIACY